MLWFRDTIAGIPSPLTLPTPPSPLTLPSPSLVPVGDWPVLGGDELPFVMGIAVSCSCVGDPLVLGILDNRGVPLPETPRGGGVGAFGLLVPPVGRCIAVVMAWREEGGYTDREVWTLSYPGLE